MEMPLLLLFKTLLVLFSDVSKSNLFILTNEKSYSQYTISVE